MHLACIWIVCHLSAQNYQNRWKFDEVLTKTNLLSFFWDTVYTCYSFFSWPKVDLLVGLRLRQTKLLTILYMYAMSRQSQIKLIYILNITEVLKVLTDVLSALDTGDVAVLTLLDLSAAFDTVDHATLLRRLKTSYGIGVLEWFTSYLSGRIQSVRCGKSASDASAVLCGLWSTAGIGPRTDTIPALHSGPTAAR